MDNTSPKLPKPRLRGWFHLGMAPFVQLLGLGLIVAAPTLLARISIAVYLIGATLLFGTSALYHRGTWPARMEAFLRRLDHANIFIFIAGTYTPLALLMLDRGNATILLTLIWSIAVLGIVVKLGWMGAPRWLYTGLYLAMGWVAVGWLVPFWNAGGPLIVALIIAGGLIYSGGAIVYARKRPDPAPAWFGYHEIFHVATVVAALCHFAAIAIITLR
ncbi:MAG: hemolysin III family protein [Propionibacteriaceae bacterium]|nr:hemolysin III family protein [Propionibacteriaceae bacterium]